MRTGLIFLGLGLIGAFLLPSSGLASAATLTTILDFGPLFGTNPEGPLIADSSGALFGTTPDPFPPSGGAVFKLTPNGDGTYSESVLHEFTGTPNDGGSPVGGLVMDASGALYGTTEFGGSVGNGNGMACEGTGPPPGCGTVFKLTPNGDGSYSETLLHEFLGYPTDGSGPGSGLIIDASGALYGTTSSGGSGGKAGGLACGVPNPLALGCGTVFKLTPNGDGTYTESILHNFGRRPGDGTIPAGGLITDETGALYGTTVIGVPGGGSQFGIVFRLSPRGDGRYRKSILHAFAGEDGAGPQGQLLIDTATGVLYGTTTAGGHANMGTIFELTPNSDGSYSESVLHGFGASRRDGKQPQVGLVFAAKGALYGTTTAGGGSADAGTVFKLKADGTERVLHRFTGTDGGFPNGPLLPLAPGVFAGTTAFGGDISACNCGTVFELTIR
ncbi:MAG TPA: choice-of-anchor tandem repeat GloVer-containing protein [Stellaceae bacterium]|nr:choice-of-anchor tandem repeat GloVer-containing protein [Stellaceae bacterium]